MNLNLKIPDKISLYDEPGSYIPVNSEGSGLRDSRGLLRNIEYFYKENGFVDYRAMLRPEHLYPNKSKSAELTKLYGKDYAKVPVHEIDDRFLLITLAGINYLAQLRGFLVVQPKVDFVSDQRCVVTTSITWVGNFETQENIVTYGQTASASIYNTFNWSQNFLESIAANRAFVRAVRFFLGLSIVGSDEMGPNKEENTPPVVELSQDDGLAPLVMLEKRVNSMGLTFEKLKRGVQQKYLDKIHGDLSSWNSYADISLRDACSLLEILSIDDVKNVKKT